MQKISPLKSSIEAFNKFRASRANKNTNTETKNDGVAQTNPFGITFRGTVIQMDVFEKTDKTDTTTMSPSLKERLNNTGKLLASAWVGTINKISSLKTNVIAFGNKLKTSTIEFAKKVQEIGSKEVDFDIFKYNVSRLQNQPVDELKTMLSAELQGVSNE